jgi:hypothetical protein
MPKELKQGILYVSNEFDTAAHLCACGCGVKIRTPLGPTEWSFEEEDAGPTLYPSIGNWQHDCQSHYFITKGEIIWSEKWTPEQINSGRKNEEERRHQYYNRLYGNNKNWLITFWEWLKRLFHQ